MSKVQKIIESALNRIPLPSSSTTPIHLALSGGVDSSVTGFLLRERGYTILPHILRCWDIPSEQEATSSSSSSSSCFEREFRAAEDAVLALGLSNELRVVDLVSTYWTEVFHSVLLSGLSSGKTPNPDLACNKHVKFHAFPQHLSQDFNTHDLTIATGHYARLKRDQNGLTQLLCGVDEDKDQSYFLASVSSQQLSKFIMPVGVLTKQQVREIASFANLPSAFKRSSRGLCFVGKSNSFASFASQFLPYQPPATFIHADSEVFAATAQWPAWAYTTGQRARIGGCTTRLLVVGTRLQDNIVIVASESDHRLYSKQARCPSVDWVSGAEPEQLTKDGQMNVLYKPCSNSKRRRAVIKKDFADDDTENEGRIWIEFEQVERRVADGQAIVLYDGDICLGASWPKDLREWDSYDNGEHDRADTESSRQQLKLSRVS